MQPAGGFLGGAGAGDLDCQGLQLGGLGAVVGRVGQPVGQQPGHVFDGLGRGCPEDEFGHQRAVGQQVGQRDEPAANEQPADDPVRPAHAVQHHRRSAPGQHFEADRPRDHQADPRRFENLGGPADVEFDRQVAPLLGEHALAVFTLGGAVVGDQEPHAGNPLVQ